MEAVERSVSLPTTPDDAWELVTDPDELGAWLGAEVALETHVPIPGGRGHVTDEDGTRRTVVFDRVDSDEVAGPDADPGCAHGEGDGAAEGRRLSWYWWTDEPVGRRRVHHDAGTGDVTHVEVVVLGEGDGSRVTVIERPVVVGPAALRARSSMRAAIAPVVTAWDLRLLHLQCRALLSRSLVVV